MPNPYHVPAGSSKGGQFTSAQLRSIEDTARKAAGVPEVDKIVYTNYLDEDTTVYRNNVSELIKQKDGLIMVGISGDHKGVVLTTSDPAFHGDMLDAVYPDDDVDNWVRAYHEEGNTWADINSAGVVVQGSESADKATKNIEYAQRKLQGLGLQGEWEIRYDVSEDDL